jgi:L-lactate dehydrogenase complex protein LldF
VRIDIPALLVHEREKVVAAKGWTEAVSMKLLGRVFARAPAMSVPAAGVFSRPLARNGWIRRFPPGRCAGGRSRDLPAVPPQTFREWWESDDRT